MTGGTAASGKWARFERPVMLLCLGLLVGGLVAHAYLSRYSRVLADDYCTYGVLQTEGFWSSQRYWYLNWSGRYAFLFTMTLFQLLGPLATPLVPALALAFWAIAAVGLLSALVGRSKIAAGGPILGLAALIGTLGAAPNLYQSLYWETGAITYALPLALATAHGAWLIRQLRSRSGGPVGLRPLVVGGLWAFAMGGFSETTVSMQTAGMALILLGSLLPADSTDRLRLRSLAAAGLAGSLGALATIALAPGSILRQLLMPTPGSLLSIAGQSVRYTLAFAANSLLDHPLAVLLPVGIAVLAGLQVAGGSKADPNSGHPAPHWPHAIWAIPLAAGLLIMAGVMPSAYAISAYPSERALLPTAYVLMLALVLWSFNLAAYLPGRWRQRLTGAISKPALTVALLLFCVALFAMSLATVSQWQPDMSSFAALWGNRHARITSAVAAGDLVLEEASLPHIGGLAELDQVASNWLNRCIALSYGLESITSR